MPYISENSFQRPLENPSQTAWGKNAGSVGLLLVGGIYVGIAPLLAGAKGSAFAVKKIYHFMRSHCPSLTHHLDSSQVKKIDKKQMETVKAFIKQSQTDLEELLQQVENKVFADNLNDIALQAESEHKLRKQTKRAFISALPLIPFVGVAAAAAYLKATTPDIKDTGVHGAIEALTQELFKGRQKLIQGTLYYLSGKTLAQWDQVYAKNALASRNELPADDPDKDEPIEAHYYSVYVPNLLQQKFNAKETPIPVERGDGRQHVLQAYTYPANRQNLEDSSHHLDLTKPTVVVFHANAQLAVDSYQQAKTYVDAGFNVVAATMGGYPGSDESIQTSEATTYQDAHAIMNYLKSQGVTDVVVHGTSIGGSLAFAAAELHPDIVKVVVADQTFNRAKDVAANLIRNTIDHGFVIPSSLVRGAVGAGFPIGEVVPSVTTLEGKPYLTDGLDNARKAASIQAEVIGIKASQDAFMGRVGDPENGYQENFADDLIRARYPKDTSGDHSIGFRGGHCDWLDKKNQKVLIEQIRDKLGITF